jgi:hypothetical protein
MKPRARVLLISLLLLTACTTRNPLDPDQSPDWLVSLTHELEAQPVASPPAYIARYEYNAETVYYLAPGCCDIWSTLYRANGTIMCHPDGGLTGNGDGRCPEFFARRKNERIVWRDPR